MSKFVKEAGDGLEIYRSGRKFLIAIGAGVVMIAASLFLITFGDTSFRRAVGWFSLVFSSAMAALGVVTWIRSRTARRPYLMLGRDVMRIDLVGGEPLELRYSEITGLRIKQISLQRFLEVLVRDPDVVQARTKSRWNRFMMRANPLVARFAPVTIAEQPLPIKLEQLIDLIQERAPHVGEPESSG